MSTFSRAALSKGFSIDPDALREAAGRQLLVSALIVVAGLFALATCNFRPASSPVAAANWDRSEREIAAPIKANVRYVNRSGPVRKYALTDWDEAD